MDDALFDREPAVYSVVLQFDPMMVAELAMGADDPLEIADRYGLSEAEYLHLSSQEWFGRLVATKRTEFHDQGVLFTAKAGMMAEALLTRLFQQSMAGTIAAPLTVEVAKQLTDIGRLKPQPLNTQPGAAGGAFQINIQVNGSDVIRQDRITAPGPTPSPAAPIVSSTVSGDSAAAAPRPATPNAQATDKAAAKMTLEFPPPPAHISNLKMPDFDVRHPGQVALAQRGSLLGAVPTVTPGLPSTPASR